MSTINSRLLAKDIYQCNDTHLTGLNNNDLIIGPTGSGKTRGYVIPNLIHNSGESFVVVDTKGTLCKTYGSYLESQGYEVSCIDFVDCLRSESGYDPIRFVGKNEQTGRYSEQDILRISAAICPVTRKNDDPYWEQSAQMTLASLIALALERFTEDSHSMETVCYLATRLGSDWLDELFEDLAVSDYDSFAVREYRLATLSREADKTIASVRGILANALNPLSFDGANHLYNAGRQVDFASLGHHKAALFVNVSDNDGSLDRLVNVFYTQGFQELVHEADKQPQDALPVPVRFILDDFAAGTVIPDFGKTISTIRSRNIAVSLVIQDLTQLRALYGEHMGTVIANNCDTWIYLGGQDVNTAEMLSKKLNKTVDSVFDLGLDELFLLRRASKPERATKYDLANDRVHQVILNNLNPPTVVITKEELEGNELFEVLERYCA